jgi:CubicO group peptidase (beta-lactamase class C family)
MRTDHIFRIASQSKAFTSVVILSLMEEGKLGINDTAGQYVPTFAHTTVAVRNGDEVRTVPARRPITIKDLLTHTAGISYGEESYLAAAYKAKNLGPVTGRGWYFADKDEPICDTIERLGTLPFVAQPGEAYVYGYNTDILGCIAEKASGQTLDELIRTRITGPLGLKDTMFFLPGDARERLVTVYASTAEHDGRIFRAPDTPLGQGDYVDGPRRNFSGGAGLLSTARDYARFLEMIRRGGELDGVRILSPRAVKLMTTNQSGTLHSNTGLGFGLGFETTDRYGANGLDEVGAFGWGGAYASTYRVDPASRLVLVMMLNQMPNASNVGNRFPTLVYQALQ